MASKKKPLRPNYGGHNPTTLYAKVDGKFVPVSEYFSHDYLRDGSYLVRVKPGCTSITTYIYRPEQATVEAAIQEIKDGIIKAFMEACKPMKFNALGIRFSDSKPDKENTVLEEANDAAVKAYVKVLEKHRIRDTSGYRIWYRSLNDLIDAGLDYLRKHMDNIQRLENIRYGIRSERDHTGSNAHE